MATHQKRIQLGGSAFNHHTSADAEAEYDRLRDLARSEHGKMASCFDRAHNAHTSSDGASAHDLSTEGKRHQALAKQYNAQASAYIFRENNAVERVPADTIDLHGQFVDEAEQILEARIRTARAEGQDHLHVIVGKGNHSPGHIQKIKPCVERICTELGLQFATEENAGRIFVALTGGQAQMPPPGAWGGMGYAQGAAGGYAMNGEGQQQQHQGYQQQGPGYQQQQPQYYPGGQQQQQQQQVQQYNGGYPGRPQQQFDLEQGQYQQGQQQQQQQQQQGTNPLTACLKSCCSVM